MSDLLVRLHGLAAILPIKHLSSDAVQEAITEITRLTDQLERAKILRDAVAWLDQQEQQ